MNLFQYDSSMSRYDDLTRSRDRVWIEQSSASKAVKTPIPCNQRQPISRCEEKILNILNSSDSEENKNLYKQGRIIIDIDSEKKKKNNFFIHPAFFSDLQMQKHAFFRRHTDETPKKEDDVSSQQARSSTKSEQKKPAPLQIKPPADSRRQTSSSMPYSKQISLVSEMNRQCGESPPLHPEVKKAIYSFTEGDPFHYQSGESLLFGGEFFNQRPQETQTSNYPLQFPTDSRGQPFCPVVHANNLNNEFIRQELQGFSEQIFAFEAEDKGGPLPDLRRKSEKMSKKLERAARAQSRPFKAELAELSDDLWQGTCHPIPERRISSVRGGILQYQTNKLIIQVNTDRTPVTPSSKPALTHLLASLNQHLQETQTPNYPLQFPTDSRGQPFCPVVHANTDWIPTTPSNKPALTHLLASFNQRLQEMLAPNYPLQSPTDSRGQPFCPAQLSAYSSFAHPALSDEPPLSTSLQSPHSKLYLFAIIILLGICLWPNTPPSLGEKDHQRIEEARHMTYAVHPAVAQNDSEEIDRRFYNQTIDRMQAGEIQQAQQFKEEFYENSASIVSAPIQFGEKDHQRIEEARHMTYAVYPAVAQNDSEEIDRRFYNQTIDRMQAGEIQQAQQFKEEFYENSASIVSAPIQYGPNMLIAERMLKQCKEELAELKKKPSEYYLNNEGKIRKRETPAC